MRLAQHLLEIQPEDIDTGERASCLLAGFRVAMAQAHLAILAGKDDQ